MSISRNLRLTCGSILVLLIASERASAAVTATRCNACSANQKYTAALNWASRHNASGGHAYVYDVPAGEMTRYRVQREPAMGGTWNYTLIEMQLSAAQASAWTQAKAILQSNSGSNFFGTVDAGSLPASALPTSARTATAYDIALTSAYRNDIDNYLMSGSNSVLLNDLVLTTTSLFNIATVFLLDQDVWEWTITWITVDGGKIDFHWSAGDNHTTITRMIDADGNQIVVDEDDIDQRYRIGAGHESNFREYMNGQFGDLIGWGPANVCVNGTLACTSSGAGYNCEWFRCGGVP